MNMKYTQIIRTQILCPFDSTWWIHQTVY